MNADNVITLTPIEVLTLCRFCMKENNDTAPHYTLERTKWSTTYIIRLFARLLDQQLPDAKQLPVKICHACHDWLKTTNDQIEFYNEIADSWQKYLSDTDRSAPDSQVLVVKEVFPAENLTVAYIDVKRCYADASSVSGHSTTSDNCDDCDEEAATSEVGEYESMATDVYGVSSDDDDDDTAATSAQPESETSAAQPDETRSTRKRQRRQSELDNRPIPSHWNVNDASVECDMCGITLARKYSLVVHFAKEHGLRGRFSCESCPEVFRYNASFHRHAKIHPPQTTFECCGRYFYSHHNLLQHQRNFHVPAQKWPCPEPLCRKVFWSEYRLSRHIVRHSAKTQPCVECGMMFHTVDDVKAHRRKVHNYQAKLICEQCGTRIGDRKVLRMHMKNGCQARPRKGRTADAQRLQLSAAPRPNLWCVHCEYRCMRPATMQLHFRKVHPTDWAAYTKRLCLKCLRQFDTVDQAALHYAKYHRFECDVCKKCLTTQESLERHRATHKTTHRPYTCPVCQGTYVSSHQLNIHHRRKHTDERPYACPQCDKRYAERWSMKAHLDTVHTQQRHECAQCANFYTTAKALATHVARKHTGEYDFFKCKHCDAQFITAHVLSNHHAVYHGQIGDDDDKGGGGGHN